MKKLFFTLCALCLSTTMMWATPTNSDYWADGSRPTDASAIHVDQTTGLYFYVNSSGNAVITYINDSYDTTSSTSLDKSSWTSGYEKSNLTSLVIPEYVSDGTNQYPVTMIGRLAFFKATNITGSLTIPSYITELGSNAFEDCSNITEVTIEYSDTALKDDANQLYGSSFWNCTSIATVHLNRNVTAGRENDNYFVTPFNQLTSITMLYVGEHVTSIPIYMFYKCSNLATVYSYAATVPALGKDAFSQIASNATLHVCQSLSNEYQNSDWATYFSTITNDLPDPDLEEGTYKDVATGLYFEINEDGTASIYHDELGVYTDDNLVAHATITDAYTLPEQVSADGTTYYNVTRVEASAFANSSISGRLVIPAYITAVGEKAFQNCTSITEVTYEYSATALSDESTGNNTNTESFNGCSGVTTVNLYRDITPGHGSNLCTPFCYNTSVATVNIGPRVTYIPQYMFRDTSSSPALTTVNCYAAVPPTFGTAPFDNFNSDYVINVPQGAEDAYASSWNSYYTEEHKGTLSNAYAVAITMSDGEENENYYATYYNSKGVDIYPQGGTDNTVTTYAIPSVNTESETAYVNLTEVGATVPAQVAVLVETNAAATYTVIETTAAGSASYNGGNCLYGLDTAGSVENDSSSYYYILTYPKDSSNGTALGFYWATEDGSAGEYQFAAHKAYLKLEKSALENVKNVALRKGEGDTTGITTIEENTAATTSTGIYTVQGVRVSNMNKQGLYIVDGKKVLVK